MRREERFKEFAKIIHHYFPPKKYRAVADIAGGKGFLQRELNSRGYNTITFDKNRDRRKRVKGINYCNKYFTSTTSGNFDLLVGLHPDAATDVIITEDIKRRIPFVVAPCCVMPFATKFNNADRSYSRWIEHLIRVAEANHYEVLQKKMAINGANIALVGKPR